MISDYGFRISDWRRSAWAAVLLAVFTVPLAAQEEAPASPVPASVASGSTDEATQIRTELDNILADPEFRRVHLKAEKKEPAELPEWLKKLIEWFADLFRPIAEFLSGLGIGIQALAWTVLMLIVALIVYLVVRMLSNYQKSDAVRKSPGRVFDQGELPAAPGELAADVYLQRALALAGEGRYREAIGLLLLGLMSHAERAGLIRHRRGLTHRDYLRAARGQASLHQSFRQVVGVYEPICFGRREARPEHFESSLIDYHSGLKNG